jgi:hypothetical protein
MGWCMRRTTVGVIATGAAIVAICAPAEAATTIGQTFTPPISQTADSVVQVSSPGSSYEAPFNGVITSWSYQAPASAPPPLRLKFYRRVGTSNDYLVVDRSHFEAITGGTLNSFPTRLSVHAGDLIGAAYSGLTPAEDAAPGFQIAQLVLSDPGPGTTATFGAPFSARLDISAGLEPDADNDGYGDETQDQCPTDPSSQLPPCAPPAPPEPPADRTPPETIIDSGPAARTKAKAASFAFHSTEAGSTFSCSLDGAPFESCSSPKTYTVSKGRHSFVVIAKDAAGNLDESPATYAWTVKKKKRKRHH